MRHPFGEWEYAADKSCQQVRICKRDSYTETRVLHQFSEWKYVADSSCEQIQRCTRDDHVETRLVHQFGEWRYVNENDCDEIRVCRRDGAEQRRVEHNWVYSETDEVDEGATALAAYQRDGDYVVPDPSLIIYKTARRCKRCGQE
jgi:hypothetical protein